MRGHFPGGTVPGQGGGLVEKGRVVHDVSGRGTKTRRRPPLSRIYPYRNGGVASVGEYEVRSIDTFTCLGTVRG
jgi:hypothetical protein